jgi:hypothetical protein
VVGRQGTAQGAMAILVVVHHIIMTICGWVVAVVPQHMAGPIMATGIGRNLIVMGTVAGIATGLFLMDMVVVDLLGAVAAVAVGDERVGLVVY